MFWEGAVDENCDFPFLDWYSYKEICDISSQKYRSFTKESHLKKKKTAFLLEMHL